MLRSLYSGVSGLTTHQTRMDVIGNNIANVNTHGFKASRVTFRDIYYQTAIGETAGRNTYAGNNSAQVGYGVRLGSIDKDMSVSNFQNSNRMLDLAIAGDGFFMAGTFDNQNLSSSKGASSVKYTRMGALETDSYGNLVTKNHSFILGSRNSLAGLLGTGNDSLNYMNKVETVDRNGDGKINASDLEFRNTINLNELMQEAYGIYTDQFGYMFNYDWNTILQCGIDYLEAQNAEGAGDTVTLTVPEGFPLTADEATAIGEIIANTFDLKAYGGTAEDFIAEAKTTTGDGDAAATSYNMDLLKQYVDVQQAVRNLTQAAGENPDDPETSDTLRNAVLKTREFVDKTGEPIELKQPVADDDEEGGEDTEVTYESLYNDLLAVINSTNQDDITEARAAIENAGGVIGELTFGDASAASIGADGIIQVTYNGELKSIARIDIGLFDNPDGLNEDGNTMFAESAASGELKIKRAGIDPGVTETSIQSNFLEMSNVNLAQEFSDMIVTQRGFQANARIITTSDSMLEELVNLKR